MPIIIETSLTSASYASVQDIMDCAMQETQDRFAVGGSNSILIEYVDRIHKFILRRRKWNWMASDIQKFITKLGQTDYWIGETAGNSAGQVDTGLNLTDVYEVQNGSMLDRSRLVELYKVVEPPMLQSFQLPDGTYRTNRIKQWRNDVNSPYVLSVYPAPDNGNTYEIIPSSPICTTATGGALSARMYFVKVAFVDARGNVGAASTIATRIFADASKLLTVKSPIVPVAASTDGVGYTKYNVYASTTEGDETLQNVGSTNIGTNWSEPGSGLISGTAAPTSSDLEPLYGYLVHFRYYKAIQDLTNSTDPLQIPSRYTDVICAGVRALAFKFLRDTQAAGEWQEIFLTGVQQMIRDQNPWPTGTDFMGPDKATQINRPFTSGTTVA